MYIPLILWIVLIILGIIIILKLVHKAVKIILSLVALFVVVTTLVIGITALMVYNDAMDIKDNFISNKKLLILEDGNEFIMGVSYKGKNITRIGDEELDSLSDYYKSSDYEQLKSKYWKVIIIDATSFVDVDSIKVGEYKLNRTQVDNIVLNNDLSGTPLPSENFREIVFLAAAKKKMSNPLFLVTAYKNGKLIIYPETITFKTIKLLPTSMLSSFIKEE